MDLGLWCSLAFEWDGFVDNLSRSGLLLNDREDTSVWFINPFTNQVMTRLACNGISTKFDIFDLAWWY